MPIQQDPAILGSIRTRSQSKDEITRILNKETKPTIADRAKSLSNDLMAYNVNIPESMRPSVLDANTVFSQRRAAMVQPHIDAFNLAQQTIDAGGKDTQAIMDTFGKFADNPEDMARLFAAAEADPEEITPQNAASFAARKAQELGLRSVKRMQAENQQMFGQARLAATTKATKDSNSGVSWMGGTTSSTAPSDSAPLPTDADLIQGRTTLLPPPAVGGATPDKSVFQGEPINSVIVNDVQVNPDRVQLGFSHAKALGSDAKIATAAAKIADSTSPNSPYNIARTSAQEAVGHLRRVNMARNAINRIVAEGRSTGQIQGFLGTLLNDPDFEIIDSANAALAMSQRVPGTGAVSNFDAQQLLNQVVNKQKSPEYNYKILAFIEASSKNAQDYADFLEWYVGSFGTTNGAQSTWSKFREDNPMVGGEADNPVPVYLPGFNADWRQWVAGQRVQKQDNKSKDISEMTLEELEAERQKLLGR